MIRSVRLPQVRFAPAGGFIVLCLLFAFCVHNQGVSAARARHVPVNGNLYSTRQAKVPVSTHVGRYMNSNYGYSFLVPEGFKAISDRPPSPQHGVLITLSESPQASIWIGGSYNTDEYSTAREAVDDDLRMITKSGSVILSSHKEAMRLDGLSAMRSIVRHREKSSRDTLVQDLVVCIRNQKNKDSIVYEIYLSTPDTSYGRDRHILESILSSWKSEPLP